jgi:hypothetical protein
MLQTKHTNKRKININAVLFPGTTTSNLKNAIHAMPTKLDGDFSIRYASYAWW